MNSEQWQRVKEAFDSALRAPPEQRAEVVQNACGGDPRLRDEVDRLLSQFARAGSFLHQPLVQTALFNPGEVVAERYKIVGLLGRGGMGEVYEAHDQLLREAIALKTLRADLAGSDSIKQRFKREIQLARKVTHSNVCRIFEVGEHTFPESARPPVWFFTMELLRGETLSALIRRTGRIPSVRAFPIAVQLAEGLQAAHNAGIVHRDFKSGNVILVPAEGRDRAVITDFGLAGLDPLRSGSDETRSLFLPEQLAGTVAYMSPEQLGGGPITAASDIYSLGIVLFEMATGQLPFDDRHLVQSAMQRASGEIPSARALVQDLHPRWESAIAGCLRKDPADRFKSAEEVAAWFGGGSWWRPRLWTRRQWIHRSATVVLPLAAAGGAWWWLARPYQPQAAAFEWYEQGLKALHSMTYESARRKFERAVEMDPHFALAHASLARAYDEMDFTDRAKDSMLQAITVAREWRLSKPDEERLLASQYTVSRDYDRAVPLVQRLEAAAAVRDKPAAALESGWLAQQRDDTDEAATAYERALQRDPGYAAAKLRLGFILGRRGGKDELALKAFDEAENLYAAASDYEGITQTILERANLLNRRSRAAEAMPVIEKGLSVARTVGNHYQEIRLQLIKGTAFRNLGEFERAGELAQQAYDQAAADNMDNLAASALIDLANLHFLRGDPKSAEPIFLRALDLAKRSKVRRLEARARFSLASRYESSRPEDARKLIEEALPFFRQAGYTRELIQSTIVLAGALHLLAEYEEGVRILRDMVPRAAELRDRNLEVQLRQRLGANLRGLGNWPEGLKEYEQAAGPLGSNTGGGFARWNCAQLYWWLGRSMEAEQSLAEVRRLVEKTPNPQLQSSLKALEAEIAYDQGRWENAARLAKQGLDAADPGDETEMNLSLRQALVLIRTGRVADGAERAARVLARFEQGRLIGNAASARLETGEASLAAGDQQRALNFAMEALAFFEPRRIWESVWRGRLVAAKASPAGPAAKAHSTAAAEALVQLKAVWPASSVEGYLERPDIKKLSSGVNF